MYKLVPQTKRVNCDLGVDFAGAFMYMYPNDAGLDDFLTLSSLQKAGLKL